ncbi:MAG: TIM barrel protein [Planctomycetes bacterium]|nr:TIM barrel protein [Planctomycetota bacterium]
MLDRRSEPTTIVPVSRRAALGTIGLAAAAVAAGCARTGSGARAAGAAADGARGLRRTMTLAEWSVNRMIKAGTLTTLDFPALARRECGIGSVEYVSTLFAGRGLEASYLGELRTRCEGEGVRSVLIMIDGEGDLGAPEAGARREAVERHLRWAESARVLGCSSIRVNARSEGTRDEQLARCADGIGTLADRAAGLGMDVIVENHGGISSDGSWMAALMRATARPNCGTLPDFGNFRMEGGGQYDRYRGIAEMLPWARDVSAKSYAFDADGNETTIDYARMFRIMDDAGYSGWVGIEFEGKGMPEREGILATKRLLERMGVRA